MVELWRSLTTAFDVSPAGDPSRRPGPESAASRRQTHRSDVIGEFNSGAQLQQGHVVVAGIGIVGRIFDDPDHRSGHLVRIQAFLVFTSEENNQPICGGAESKRRWGVSDPDVWQKGPICSSLCRSDCLDMLCGKHTLTQDVSASPDIGSEYPDSVTR